MKLLTPRNDTAEKAALGSFLVDSGAFMACTSFLEAGHYYTDGNRAVHEAIGRLVAKRAPVDMVSVQDELKQAGKEEIAGGMAYLAECMGAVTTSSHAEHYAKIVSRHYYEREILNTCRNFAADQTPDLLAEITRLVNAKEGLAAPVTFSYKTNLYDFLDRIMAKNDAPQLKLGLKGLDHSFAGLKPGEITTWAAPTNTGKSLMLLNLMHNAAEVGNRCLYVGTEMSAHETVQRHVSVVSGVEPWRLRKAVLGPQEIKKISDALADKMQPMPVHILDTPEPGLKDIEAAIVSSKAEVVFLDYLERFTLPREESMRLRVKEFMRRLKTIARTRNVVIHLASQLNRSTYGKEDTRPSMADISESSAVEKESDRVLLMWTPKAKQVLSSAIVLEVIISKDRHSGGKGAIFDLWLDKNSLKITEGGTGE